MRLLGLAIGVLVVVAAAISFTAPDLRLAFERSAMTPAGLTTIAILRIALGATLIFAARASRAPWMIRALGIIVIVAGLVTPLFGVARSRAVVDWLTTAGPVLMRLDALVGMTLGAFLVYMFRRPSRGAS